MGKDTLESIASFSEFWGVLITVVGAVLLFAAVLANRPLKKLLAAEAEAERQESKHQQLVLQGQIAEANARAAQANERAEQEHLARIRIEERLASRRIGKTDHDSFVSLLSRYAKTTVLVQRIEDFEAGKFADDIIKVLSDAKWNLQIRSAGMIAPPVYGLQCAVDQSEAGKSLASVLQRLPTAVIHVGQLPEGIHAQITIGLKPPP